MLLVFLCFYLLGDSVDGVGSSPMSCCRAQLHTFALDMLSMCFRLFGNYVSTNAKQLRNHMDAYGCVGELVIIYFLYIWSSYSLACTILSSLSKSLRCPASAVLYLPALGFFLVLLCPFALYTCSFVYVMCGVVAVVLSSCFH